MNRHLNVRGVLALSFVTATAITIGCTSATKSDNDVASSDTSGVVRETAAAGAQELPVKTNYIEEVTGDNWKNRITKNASVEAVAKIGAGLRIKRIFELARGTSIEFFRELRVRQPIFKIEGGGGIPNVYVVTKYADVVEALSEENSPIFAVKPYRDIMDKTVGAPYMLGRDGKEFPRDEKPKMRHVLPKNDLVRVRQIIRQLAVEAIEDGSSADGTLDVVAKVSRDVPIGMNGEYFGFPGPSRAKMAEWSRATQHAFFHNPSKNEKVNAKSIRAGKEMEKYISTELLPNRILELKNGRPAYDPVSRMIQAAQAHEKMGLSADRIIRNTIGLLVGSVETTNAAIVQSLNYLLEHPNLLAGAIQAAKDGNQDLFDRYVWEALRFDPVNPWVARVTTQNYLLGRGKPWATNIEKGALVLIATESAMHDPEVFPNSHLFSLTRDPSLYLHLGYATHRCLGDDVSTVMVPETIKQLILLPGIRKVDPAKGKDFPRNPFPELYFVRYDRPSAPALPFRERLEKKAESLFKFAGLSYIIADGVVHMEQRKEVLQAANLIINGKGQVRSDAIDRLPAIVANATKDVKQSDLQQLCEKNNPKSVEVFPNPAERSYYCSVRIDFRVCYFFQVLAGGKSKQHAYNHCAYAKNLLTENERSVFADRLGSNEQFSFLNFK